MKAENYGILYFFLLLPFIILLRLQIAGMQTVFYLKTCYDIRIENAVKSGVQALKTIENGRGEELPKGRAKKQFYHSLFTSFGILHNREAQNRLEQYIPIIMITDTDGFYIWIKEEQENGELLEKWSEKFFYTKAINSYIVYFTINQEIRIQDKLGIDWEGDYQQAEALFPEIRQLWEKNGFEEYRRMTITGKIVEKMTQYLNSYNRIAKHQGISYQFSLPILKEEDWACILDDITFMAVFQGYPLGIAGKEYQNYGIGGARIKKDEDYYIQREADGRLLYHTEKCMKLSDKTVSYDTKQQCALQEAYPCEICKP